jgi:hypothetical protein
LLVPSFVRGGTQPVSASGEKAKHGLSGMIPGTSLAISPLGGIPFSPTNQAVPWWWFSSGPANGGDEKNIPSTAMTTVANAIHSLKLLPYEKRFDVTEPVEGISSPPWVVE